MILMPAFKDLKGQKFGRLLVLERSESKHGCSYWLCQCDCGNSPTVISYNLISGKAKSCGCLQRELAAKQGKNNTKHGNSRRSGSTRLYAIWNNMKARCTNPKTEGYERYGGRGITICNEWINDFTSFLEWAMENGYNDELTIDRIDSNGNYEPSNCRWATKKVQSNNRSSNRIVEINGNRKTLAEWSDYSGISLQTLCHRLNHLGWKEEDLLSQVGGWMIDNATINKALEMYNSGDYLVKDIAVICGISVSSLYGHIRKRKEGLSQNDNHE